MTTMIFKSICTFEFFSLLFAQIRSTLSIHDIKILNVQCKMVYHAPDQRFYKMIWHLMNNCKFRFEETSYIIANCTLYLENTEELLRLDRLKWHVHTRKILK